MFYKKSIFKLRFKMAAWGGLCLLAAIALAVSASNSYVSVECDTAGVEDIVSIDNDFYITTRGVSAPSFIAEVGVTANSPWTLVEPSSGSLSLGIGDSGSYRVKDESGTEDEAWGSISVLKLDIEQSETNVCWKTTLATLNLTSDSSPGGTAEWTSEPTGISGSGTSITFNPSSLTPGEYIVTAKSSIVPSYSDTCVVRVIKVDIEPAETNVCWKASSATLSLTPDSYLGGGTANWTSEPAGNSGSGTSIAFNPSSLTPGAYVVTARSSVLPNCADTCMVNIIKVDILGFSNENVWPLHPDCSISLHQTTCLATILPANLVSTLRYSIQGNAHDASIDDPSSGVITPGFEQSGDIVVRVASTTLPMCYCETNLTIHAIPVEWVSSTVVPAQEADNVYGAGWVHSFSSSGGSLEGVFIAEAVTNQPPNLFGYNYDVPAPPLVYGNQWELTADGTMVDADYYLTAKAYIDATDFSTFPQVATDHQWYYWNCPNCAIWTQFTGPHEIKIVLDDDGYGGYEVRTEAYGKTNCDEYTGAVPDPLGDF